MYQLNLLNMGRNSHAQKPHTSGWIIMKDYGIPKWKKIVENISSPLKLSLVRRVRLAKALFLKLFRLFALDDETIGQHDML